MFHLPVISFNKLQLSADSEVDQAPFQGSARDSPAPHTIIFNSASCLKPLQYYFPLPNCLPQHLISAIPALQLPSALPFSFTCFLAPGSPFVLVCHAAELPCS